MLHSIRIGCIKSFAAPQTLTLCQANGNKGSGYNVIVGANNSGKSTIVTLVRHLLSREGTLTIGRESRRDPERPLVEIEWLGPNSDLTAIGIDTNVAGAIFPKTGSFHGLANRLRFVPSRRPFGSEYSTSGMEPSDYEHSELMGRLGAQAHFDSQLATAIAKYFVDPINKALFIATLNDIDPRSVDFATDNVGGRNVMLYEGPSKRPHVLSDTGDGITNLIRIVFTLVTSAPGDCLIIDETRIVAASPAAAKPVSTPTEL